MTDWQPIDTAPKDGTIVLLALSEPVETADVVNFMPTYQVQVVIGWWWKESALRRGAWECSLTKMDKWDGDLSSLAVSPTHWMPLPEPPRTPDERDPENQETAES